MVGNESYQKVERIFLAVLGVLACYYLVTVTLYILDGNVFGDNYDFSHYYKAADRLFNDPDNFYPQGLDRQVAFQGFTYPPLAILMVIPFSFFDIYTGSILWSLFCLLNVYIAVRLLVKIFENSDMDISKTQKAILIVFLTATAPAMHNYIFLQVNFIILNTCLGYIVCVQQSRANWLAGFVLSLGVWLKVYPILLLGLGVLYSNYRPSMYWTLAWTIILPAIFLFVVPFEHYQYYILELLPQLGSNAPHSVINQSLIASIARQTLPIDAIASQEFTVTTGLKLIAVAVAGIFCIAALFRRIKQGNKTDVSLPFAVLSMMVIIAPLSWGYTWILAMPFVIFMLLGSRFKLLCMAGSTAFFLPSYYELESIIPLQSIEGAIFYSRYSIAILALLGIYFFEQFYYSKVEE